MHEGSFSIRKRGQRDKKRLKEKVEEAIRDNITRYLFEQSIITKRAGEIVKIPLRGLKLPEFEFDYSSGATRIGTGKGGTPKLGNVLGIEDQDQSGDSKAGSESSEPIYEAEILIEDLVNIIFDELELPNLEEIDEIILQSKNVEYNDVRPQGIHANLDLKRTLLQNLKRNSALGFAEIKNISREDLRFKVWEEIEEKNSRACIIAMMDTSGSMGTHEQFLVRTVLTWVVWFLRKNYDDNLEIQFITHDVIARRVDEDHFFRAGATGGTKFSPPYKLAKEIISEEFPPKFWNLYIFHFTDGENLTSDNEETLQLINELLNIVKRIYYGEVNRWPGNTFIGEVNDKIDNKRLITTTLKDKDDIFKAVKDLLGTRGSIHA